MDAKTKLKLVSDIRQDNIYNRPLVCEKCKSAIMKYAGSYDYFRNVFSHVAWAMCCCVCSCDDYYIIF